MGNEASLPVEDQPANVKLQNGAANGHASIPSEDVGETVACETAVQQNSANPSLPTNEASTPSVNELDGGEDPTKDTPLAPESVVLPISKTASPSPEDPSQQPVNESIAEECLKPAPETPTVPDPAPKEKEPNRKEGKRAHFFGKVFKKKNKSEIEKEPASVDCNGPPEDQEPSVEAPVLTNGLHSEPGDVEGTTTVGKDSEDLSPNDPPAGDEALKVDGETVHQVDAEEQAEESPVMNFFKTLVAPSKAPKEEVAPPAVPVEEVKVSEEPEPKAQVETSPAAPPVDPSMAEPKAPVPAVKIGSPFGKLFKPKQSSKGSKPETTTKAIEEVDASTADNAPKPPPPPPPPEPPKIEVKGEPTAMASNSAQTEAPKDAVKEPEAASKQKPTKGSTFLKLFHPKEEEKQEEEEPQPVEEEVTETGDSKAKATDVRIPPGKSPKAEKKSGKSNLASLFKPTAPKRQIDVGVQTDPVTITYPSK